MNYYKSNSSGQECSPICPFDRGAEAVLQSPDSGHILKDLLRGVKDVGIMGRREPAELTYFF